MTPAEQIVFLCLFHSIILKNLKKKKDLSICEESYKNINYMKM